MFPSAHTTANLSPEGEKAKDVTRSPRTTAQAQDEGIEIGSCVCLCVCTAAADEDDKDNN